MNRTPEQWNRIPSPEEPVTARQTLRATAFTLIFLTIAPPVAVILWKIAWNL